MFTSNSKLKAVISYQSSALLNVNKFSNEKIKAVTFISFIDNSIEDEYINLMKKSNVLDIMNFLNEK